MIRACRKGSFWLNYRKYEPMMIRTETPYDYAAIRQVLDAAFGQPEEGDIVDCLRRSPDFIPELALVSEENDQIIACIHFSHLIIHGETKTVSALSLAPVAVLPGRQRRGIGSQLIRAALEEARKRGYTAVLVLGHPEYYPRFGFRRASAWGIQLPFPAPDEAFMGLELQPGALSDAAGMVRFSDCFGV